MMIFDNNAAKTNIYSPIMDQSGKEKKAFYLSKRDYCGGAVGDERETTVKTCESTRLFFAYCLSYPSYFATLR